MYEMIEKYAEEKRDEVFTLLKDLCGIPAPSHSEEKRAEFIKNWLEDIGATRVYIDDALNVIFPLNCENSNEITVFAAHTDTVFPDIEPMPYIDDGTKIHSPGVADDTASVVAILLMAKYFTENNIIPKKGIMFVLNSCEEGLGNLKGTRKLFSDFKTRIKRFITFDANLGVVNDVCVGSHRYEVEVLTEGGHSYLAFGNKNAINIASKIINNIYKIEVPKKEGAKTTYNVGTISGGTSVNTIAQNVKFLCEYRSDNVDCLSYMEKEFEKIFENAKEDDVSVNVKKIGIRPCADIDIKKVEELKDIIVPEIEKILKKKVDFKSSSTDCNIPLSLGIPALCVGVNSYEGMHTREEWVDKESIITGLKVGLAISMKFID